MTPKYGRAPNKTKGAVVIFPTTSWIQNGAGSSTLQDTFAEETAFWKTDRTYPVITVLNLHGQQCQAKNNMPPKASLKPTNQPTNRTWISDVALKQNLSKFGGPKNTNFRWLVLGFLCFKGVYVLRNDKKTLVRLLIYDWILNSWLDLKSPQRFGINLASRLIPLRNNLNP